MAHYRLNDQIYWFDSETEATEYQPNAILMSETEVGLFRQSKIISMSYHELRVSEYPPMIDYIDAIVKGDKDAQQIYIDKCLAIKAKYPKPTI